MLPIMEKCEQVLEIASELTDEEITKALGAIAKYEAGWGILHPPHNEQYEWVQLKKEVLLLFQVLRKKPIKEIAVKTLIPWRWPIEL